MGNSVVEKFLNRNNAQLLIMAVLIFIFYLVVENVYDLTKLIIKYETTFDYGKHLKGLCANEYFEAETPRFHINKDVDDLALPNDNNKKKYYIVVLIITIIVSLFISVLLSYIIYNTLYNEDMIDDLLNRSKDSFQLNLKPSESMYENIKNYIIYTVYLIKNILFDQIVNITKIFYSLIVNKPRGSFIQNVSLFIIIVFIYLVILAIFALMPIYIGLKLSNKADISPFNTDFKVYVPYIILFVIICLLRFCYVFFEYKDNISYSPLVEYFSSNIKNLQVKNTASGYIVFFVCLAIYICMFYILGNVINFSSIDNSVDEEKFMNYNIRKNVIYDFINNTLGYKEYGNYKVPYVYVKKPSGIVFTILIILMVIIVLYIITTNIETDEINNSILKYGIIVPLFILLLIIFGTNNVQEYNTYINKYILYNPSHIYKQYIDVINKIFNVILMKEYDNTNTNKDGGYLCRNIGNSILLTLYSNLFQNIENISREGDSKAEKNIDITPEFKYDKLCSDNSSFDFNTYKEYDISYYINHKKLNKNIFYSFTNCEQINTDVLKQMGINLQIFSEEEQTDIVNDIYEKMYTVTSIKYEDPLIYIKEFILNKDNYKDTINNYKNKLKQQIFNSIANIKNNNTYNDKSKVIIYYDKVYDKYYLNNELVKMKSIEIELYNNKLSNNLQNTSKIDSVYENIVDDICDSYMDNIYAYLYVFTPLYINIVKFKNTEDSYYKYQEDFIRLICDNIKRTFTNINTILASPISRLKKDVFTRYIIQNYNNVNTEKLYTKNVLEMIQQNKVEINNSKEVSLDIKTYYSYLQKLTNITDNINKLIKSLRSNEYTSLQFLSTFQVNKFNLQDIITEFEKYNDNTEFKININTILRYDDNVYYVKYDLFDINTRDKTTVELKNDIYEITFNMMNICKMIFEIIQLKYNIYIKKFQSTDDNSKMINYDKDLDTYQNILKKNINNLNNDYLNYKNNTKYIVQEKEDTIADFTKDISLNILKDAENTQKLIYIIVIYYIFMIVMSKIIII